MPSAAGVPQAGMSLGIPSTETRQMRQLATLGSFGYQQRVGMSIPRARAASRIVAPGSKGSWVPFRVKLDMEESFRPKRGPIRGLARREVRRKLPPPRLHPRDRPRTAAGDGAGLRSG